jgi:5-enolpyruvylshikimate-3-phosphate synthase
MIVALIEEGVSLAPISRATGIPVDELAALPCARSTPVADAEELSRVSTRLAMRALQEGLRILAEGEAATRVRLITSIAGHPLRKMQTDQSAAQEEMKRMFDAIMSGGAVIDDGDEPGEDVDEDRPHD